MDEEKVYCSMYSRNAELYHHGIKGQKWGVRNGPPYPLGSDVSNGSRLKNVGSSSFKENTDELKEEKKLLKKMAKSGPYLNSSYEYDVDGYKVYAHRKIYDGSSGKFIYRVVKPEESLKMKKREISDIKEIIKNKDKIISDMVHNKKFLDEINTDLSFYPEEDNMPTITPSNFSKYFSLDNAFSADYYNGNIDKPFYSGTMEFKLDSETYLGIRLSEDKKRIMEIEMITM